jgi:Inorganic Pyrophosphatase
MRKEFSAPTSATSGIAGYDLSDRPGRKKKAKLRAKPKIHKIHHPHKKKVGGKWRVVDSDGHVYGSHSSESKADAQLAALYANKKTSLRDLAKQSIDGKARDVDYSPSKAKVKAGNYKKGKLKISGLDIRVENPAGSTRKGKNWSQFMVDHYGYISRTTGSDDDQVDCFIKPGTDDGWQGMVFVVDQSDQFGVFDEHKVMLGYSNEREARQAYLANYPSGWQGLGAIHPVPFKAFVAWVHHGNTTEPLGAKKVNLSDLLKRELDGHDHLVVIIKEVIDSVSAAADWIKPTLNKEIHEIRIEAQKDLDEQEGEGTMAEYDDHILQISEDLETDHYLIVPNVGTSHNVGRDFRTVLSHELAHALYDKVDELLKEQDMATLGEVWVSQSPDYWKKTISEYCQSPHETWCEAFAAWVHPYYSSATPLPLEYVNVFEALDIKQGIRKVDLRGLLVKH